MIERIAAVYSDPEEGKAMLSALDAAGVPWRLEPGRDPSITIVRVSREALGPALAVTTQARTPWLEARRKQPKHRRRS